MYLPDSDSTTIIGGSGDDIVTCVSASNGTGGPGTWLMIGGYTNSRDLVPADSPNQTVLQNAFQSSYEGGDHDGFYIYFYGGSYNQIVISYFGGSGDDRVLAVNGAAFAVGGSTNSFDLPTKHGWQSGLAGGTDGFLAVFVSPLVGLPTGLLFSSYVGGSGDDRVLAIAPSPDYTTLYAGGDGRSENWQIPGFTGQSQGPSDGFLLRTQFPQYGASGPFQASGIWIGGGADDRVTALAPLSTGEIVAAGTTSSADFSLPSASSTLTYHGGDSDVFLAKYSADLQTAQSVQLIGGSGAEEALSLAISPFDEVLVGGWTSSADFPAVNATQATYGGGASDGFLYRLDAAWNVALSTWVGGTGADRISFVNFDPGAKVLFSGDTDSPTVPFPARYKGSMAGPYRGFWATMTEPVIHVSGGVTIGKDLMVTISARLGDPDNTVGTPVTISSADARSVLAADVGDDGHASILLAHAPTGSYVDLDPPVRKFQLMCLTDNASVPVTLSAPGYADATIAVQCAPSGFAVSQPQIANPYGAQSFSVYPAVFDPSTQTPRAAQAPRPGVTISVAAVSADPKIATIQSSPTMVFDSDSAFGNQLPGFVLGATVNGETDIQLSTDSGFAFIPTDHVHVVGNATSHTLSVYTATTPAKDTFTSFTLGSLPSGTTITATSSDPSRVLLALASELHFQASVTETCTSNGCSGIEYEVLDDSAPVNVIFEAPGYDKLVFPLRIGDRRAQFTSTNHQPVNYTMEIVAGQSMDLTLDVFGDPRVYGDNFPLRGRPDGPSQNGVIAVSDGTVASSSVQAFTMCTTCLLSQQVSIKGLAPGLATISAAFAGSNIAVTPLRVKVLAAGPQANPVTVGKNLQTAVYSRTPTATDSQSQLRVTSLDPSRVLVSADGQSLGQSTILLPPGRRDFLVQGLADSGQVSLTLEAEGKKGQMSVTLAPAGLAWSTERVTLAPRSSLRSNAHGICAGPGDDDDAACPTADSNVDPGHVHQLRPEHCQTRRHHALEAPKQPHYGRGQWRSGH